MFNDEEGDCYNIRQIVGTAKNFNPLFLIGKLDAEIITMLHPLTDKLTNVGYTHFIYECIVQLKIELPKIVKEADNEHDLDKIKPSKLFQTRMEK